MDWNWNIHRCTRMRNSKRTNVIFTFTFRLIYFLFLRFRLLRFFLLFFPRPTNMGPTAFFSSITPPVWSFRFLPTRSVSSIECCLLEIDNRGFSMRRCQFHYSIWPKFIWWTSGFCWETSESAKHRSTPHPNIRGVSQYTSKCLSLTLHQFTSNNTSLHTCYSAVM
jgi:hypothetical protein